MKIPQFPAPPEDYPQAFEARNQGQVLGLSLLLGSMNVDDAQPGVDESVQIWRPVG